MYVPQNCIYDYSAWTTQAPLMQKRTKSTKKCVKSIHKILTFSNNLIFILLRKVYFHSIYRHRYFIIQLLITYNILSTFKLLSVQLLTFCDFLENKQIKHFWSKIIYVFLHYLFMCIRLYNKYSCGYIKFHVNLY